MRRLLACALFVLAACSDEPEGEADQEPDATVIEDATVFADATTFEDATVFADAAEPAPDATEPNDTGVVPAAIVVINEIESSGGDPGDWVELYNAGDADADLSGWTFKDNDDTHVYTFPAGTSLAASSYLVLEEATFNFGLGAADSARIFDSAETLIDSHDWSGHASESYGRCPNATGAFSETGAVSKGSGNDCNVTAMLLPWPGENNAVTADDADTFGGNLSDLFYDEGALWAVQNGPSTLYRLTSNSGVFSPARTQTLRYPNNTGSPDAEGVTKADALDAIYVATERDNDDAATSRMSILRFDLASSAPELAATGEWDLTADLPAAGENVGLEAITWIPDSFLVANNFFDEATQSIYDPADYVDHGTGIFFVGLEANGMIYAYALDHVNDSATRIATIDSGHLAVVALSFDRETNYLWSHCDDTCDGESAVLTVGAGGRFAVRQKFARPSTMPNINNEGIAIASESACSGGFKPFFYSDDAETGGHAIRVDSIPCGMFLP